MIRSVLEAEAERQLAGVGDASLGEWRKPGRSAFHLRRRLSTAEQAAVGLVADIRGTAEARQRAARVGGLLALAPAQVLRAELGADRLWRTAGTCTRPSGPGSSPGSCGGSRPTRSSRLASVTRGDAWPG